MVQKRLPNPMAMRGIRTSVFPKMAVGKPLASYFDSEPTILKMEQEGNNPDPATSNPAPTVPLINFRREQFGFSI
jgi:hypothetical protein